MRIFGLLVALGLLGCGPDFNGTFSGNITTTGSCSDGSGVPQRTDHAEWEIEDRGDELVIDPVGGTCGNLTARMSKGGSMAEFAQKTCPSSTFDGVTVTSTFTGGTLSLSGESLAVSLLGRVEASGAMSGTCNVTMAGTLAREE
jgi:hypothetical protein